MAAMATESCPAAGGADDGVDGGSGGAEEGDGMCTLGVEETGAGAAPALCTARDAAVVVYRFLPMAPHRAHILSCRNE